MHPEVSVSGRSPQDGHSSGSSTTAVIGVHDYLPVYQAVQKWMFSDVNTRVWLENTSF